MGGGGGSSSGSTLALAARRKAVLHIVKHYRHTVIISVIMRRGPSMMTGVQCGAGVAKRDKL